MTSRGPPPPVMKRPPGLRVQLSEREKEIFIKVGLQVETPPPKPEEVLNGEDPNEEDEEEEEPSRLADDDEPFGNDSDEEIEDRVLKTPLDLVPLQQQQSSGQPQGGSFAVPSSPSSGDAPELYPALSDSSMIKRFASIRKNPTLKRRSGLRNGELGDDGGEKLVQGATEDIMAGYQFVRTSSERSLEETGPGQQDAQSNSPQEGNSAATTAQETPEASKPTEAEAAASSTAPPEGGAGSPTLKKRPTLYGVASSLITTQRNSKNAEANLKTDRVEMIKEGPSGKNIVCIGTVWALVGVFTAVGELDSDYVLEFLSTHKLFTSSLKVFQYMIARSGAIGKGGADDIQLSFTQGRIFTVLEQWLFRRPSDFVNNPSFFETLKKYVQMVPVKSQNKRRLQTLKSLVESANKRLAASIEESTALFNQTLASKVNLSPYVETPAKITSIAEEPSSPATPNTPLGLGSASAPALATSPQSPSPLQRHTSQSSFYTRASRAIPEFPGDFKAAHLAELLSTEEAKLFRSITEEDFANYVAGADKETSRIKIFSRWSQLVVYWVASEVCKPDDAKNRVEVIKYFLVTASQCRGLQNYNAVSEIIRGLNLSPSQRLLKTWKALPSSLKEMYQELSALVSSKDNYSAYRVALQQSTGNVLPIFKAYLVDLGVVTEKMETELPGGQINFYKFHVIGNILNSIYFCQKNTNYEFDTDKALRQYVGDMISASALQDTDSLAKLSRAREAPVTSAESLVFGIELALAVDRTGVITFTESTVPACVRDIVEALRRDKMKTLGIFRKSGNQTNIKKMKAQIDRVGGLIFDFETVNPHDLAGLLKQYFSDLPDPLFTGQLSPKFIAISEVKDPKRKLEMLQGLMAQLPKPHLDVAIYLLQFLLELSQIEENQMGVRNISVCFAPTLFGKKKPVRKISLLQSRVSQAMDIMKQETLEADLKKQENIIQVMQLMLDSYADLIPSTTFGKNYIDYTRRDSVAQF